MASWLPLFVLCSFLLLIDSATGAEIRGTVTDAKTIEPIIGASIKIVGTSSGAITGLDGSYHIRNVSVGTLALKVSYSGYHVRDTVVVVEETKALVHLDVVLELWVIRGSDVTVTAAADHGSDAAAQITERTAQNVISTVSARSIEVSPDISVANVTQRVSGVSITRNSNGDGQYAIIRGMDKRYNYTTVNGIKIPSPDNKNRYVPLDIFPAELLDRLEVTKSLLPTMEGDAIGGAMNLVMKQAPDNYIASFNAGSGYDGLFFGRKFYSFDFNSALQSPRQTNGPKYAATMADFPLSNMNPRQVQPGPNQYYSATIGNRFLEDRSLGMIVSGSYQNSFRGANTTYFVTDVNAETNLPALVEIQDRKYSALQLRAGAQTNIDYRINDLNKLELFGMFASLKVNELRDLVDTNLQLGWQGPGSGRIIYERRSVVQTQSIGNITLSGSHIVFGKDLEAHWNLVYSNAALNQPDRSQLDLTTGVDKDSSGRFIPEPTYVNNGSSRRWENNVDQDKTVYLTLVSTETLFGTPTEFSYGGMFRAKNRTSSYDDYNIRPSPSPQVYNGDISRNTFNVFNPYGTSDDPLDYRAHENVFAGFIQAKFQVGNLMTVGGVRIENTDFGWATDVPITATGKTGSIGYTSMLPSVSFKYMPSADQNWRLSYFKSISRPGFFEVIPNNGIPGDDYTEVTNPYLRPTQANNVDLRWEYFPGGLDQLLVGFFYKNLLDPIEYAVEVRGVNSVLVPDNFGTATNYGFEMDLRKYFSIFGIKVNYTFTNSQITTNKTVRYRDAGGQLTQRIEQQTRPLQGQSENIGNLALLYRDNENGTDAQLGVVYTGTNIVTVSPFKDNDIWLKGYAQIDFSAEQHVLGPIALYVKINNLLDSPREEVIHQTYAQSGPYPISYQTPGSDVLVRREQYNRTYLLGLRYKL